VQAALKRWCDGKKVDLVITVGGTGFTTQDITPEATQPLLHKQAPGLVSVMMEGCMDVTPTMLLSRPMAGIRNGTLIINMPGSPNAVAECLDTLMPALPHGLTQLQGVKDSGCRAAPHVTPHPYVGKKAGGGCG
jgi:gephyrin